MLPFVHGRLARYESLVEVSNRLAGQVLKQDPRAVEAVSAHLEAAAAAYRSLGRSEVESRLLNLRLDIHAARHGPARRAGADGSAPRPRELERAAVLAAVQAGAELLQIDLQRDRAQLQAARDMVVPITLAALQKKLLRASRSGRYAHTLADAEALWRLLLADIELRLPCQRVALTVSVYDAHLLLQEQLAALDAAGRTTQASPARRGLDGDSAAAAMTASPDGADIGDRSMPNDRLANADSDADSDSDEASSLEPI